MNLNGGVFPLHGVNAMLLELHHQMAEQYSVYSAASPAVHTLSVAERLAGMSTENSKVVLCLNLQIRPYPIKYTDIAHISKVELSLDEARFNIKVSFC